jgi:hypothetical protein
MCLPNIDEWFIVDNLDRGVEVDAVHMVNSICYFLYVWGGTLTKVVLPVPDMPIAMMQILLF